MRVATYSGAYKTPYIILSNFVIKTAGIILT